MSTTVPIRKFPMQSLMQPFVNYSTFAREHAQSLMGITAEGQTPMQAAMGPLTERAQAAAAVVTEASKLASQVGSPWRSLVDNRTA